MSLFFLYCVVLDLTLFLISKTLFAVSFTAGFLTLETCPKKFYIFFKSDKVLFTFLVVNAHVFECVGFSFVPRGQNSSEHNQSDVASRAFT